MPKVSRSNCLAVSMAVWLALGGPAAAQLPALPQTPLPDMGQVVRDTAPVVTGALKDVRNLRLRDLVRGNRRLLELEQGQAIVRHEVVAIAPTPAALAAARAEGFSVTAAERLDGLDTDLVILRAPERHSTRRALKRLRALDPQGVYDFNHLYIGSGETPGFVRHGAGGGAPGRARAGLIDGGVDVRHPDFSGATIETRAFAGAVPVSTAHGTAVASLLLAGGVGRLYAADVYGGSPIGGSTTALARALAWMAQEQVAVVNVSLVGPPNRALQSIVASVVSRGVLVVAAVGNDGPAAPPLYPAAYDGVVGVTGVNRRGQVLVEALRGPQVDFAAPGADLRAAVADGRHGPVRGTSFAAPIVAAMLAHRMSAPGRESSARALGELAAAAQDLGTPGRDNTFGAGLVGRADLASR